VEILAISRTSLGDRVYQELRQLIIRHEPEPGERIALAAVAEQLEVSLTPLREALMRPEQEGFVTRHVNRGFFVAELTSREATELFQMREALECYALTLSVPALTDAEVAEVAGAAEAYSQVLDQPDRDRFLEDKTLHLRFAALARNRTLLAALEQVLDRTIMKLRVEELPRERGPAAHAEHLRVVDALRARDLARATEELRAHIRTSRAYIVANLEAKASRPEAAASERRPRRA
jgi:DNA-binding GntR family transcriptional regulator